MTTPTAVTAAYIHALMGATEPDTLAGRKLSDWIRFHQAALGIDFRGATVNPVKPHKPAPLVGEALSPRKWQRLRDAVGNRRPAPEDKSDTAMANLTAFANAVRLDPLETEIFRFVFHCDRDGNLDRLCGQLVESRQFDSAGVVAIAIGAARTNVEARLTRGPLRLLGLIDGGGDGASRFIYTTASRIWYALLPPNLSLADAERSLIGMPARASLAWDDFAHLAAERDFAARLIQGALARRTRGVNLLLYGPPGTGKTELCKALAAHADADLFAIGEMDQEGDEPSRFD